MDQSSNFYIVYLYRFIHTVLLYPLSVYLSWYSSPSPCPWYLPSSPPLPLLSTTWWVSTSFLWFCRRQRHTARITTTISRVSRMVRDTRMMGRWSSRRACILGRQPCAGKWWLLRKGQMKLTLWPKPKFCVPLNENETLLQNFSSGLTKAKHFWSYGRKSNILAAIWKNLSQFLYFGLDNTKSKAENSIFGFYI